MINAKVHKTVSIKYKSYNRRTNKCNKKKKYAERNSKKVKKKFKKSEKRVCESNFKAGPKGDRKL